MSPTSPVFAAGALVIAVIALVLVDGLFGSAPAPDRRYRSLDGLRGYLALAVFFHHSAIWFFYLRSGVWALPPSRLYTHFGQSAVALFFMITALLFWSKIADGRNRPVDWLRLYVSRVLRLVPLYVLAIGAVWFIVFASAGFALQVPARTALTTTIRWLSFTTLGAPPLNGFAETNTALASAVWSLPYEWWFYATLPIAALLFRRQPWFWILFSVVIAGWGAQWALSQYGRPITASFLGGIAAAAAARSPRCRTLASGSVAAVLCLAALAAVTRTDTAFDWPALALLSVAFGIIACGNTLFGLLNWRVSRILGEMGYSVYLLHGMVLFVAFRWIAGDNARTLSVAEHWGVVFACAPVLVALCYATFNLVEWPAMSSVDRVTAWLRNRSSS